MSGALNHIDPDAAQRFLEETGYEVTFREHGWVECLLRKGPDDAWVGRGRARVDAIRSALAQAFPSAAAVRALERALAYERAGAAGPTAAPQMVASRDGAGEALMFSGESSERFVSAERSLEVLEILIDRIADSREELGLCSAERQRLAIMAWICEARSHAECWDADPRVRDKVTEISRSLTEIGKVYWPGSVSALQLHIEPSALPKTLLGGSAISWRSAADLAEQALRAREYEDERRGRDAHGWADHGAIMPPPKDPVGLLDQLVAEIEDFSGSLERQAQPKASDSMPSAEDFSRWVRQLRWLRTSEVPPRAWASAAGRLRWWASRKDVALSSHVRELHSGHVPRRPWSQLAVGAEAEGQESATTVPPGVVEAARRLTEGKRSVLVSHRREPGLQETLVDLLGFESFECRIAEGRRIETLGEAIQQGEYDLVIGAVGFQAQSVDSVLARACRQAEVTYVRVSAGQPAVCARALARRV